MGVAGALGDPEPEAPPTREPVESALKVTTGDAEPDGAPLLVGSSGVALTVGLLSRGVADGCADAEEQGVDESVCPSAPLGVAPKDAVTTAEGEKVAAAGDSDMAEDFDAPAEGDALMELMEVAEAAALAVSWELPLPHGALDCVGARVKTGVGELI